jgi:hypothetical protein
MRYTRLMAERKLQYKSDSQVRKHIVRSGPEKSESMAHEARESKSFERAEHRIGYKKSRR